jgi:putative hemin transport protein
MEASVKPQPREILRARAENPKTRERDFAQELGITEADYVAAHVGESAIRLEPRVNDVLAGLEGVGEVMALTRNESAVHEKIGAYDKVVTGDHNALVLGEQIDLRIFPKVWAHGFAVEKKDGDEIRRSLQFFDKAGDAVHKVHLRPASNLDAYQALVSSLVAEDQRRTVDTVPLPDTPAEGLDPEDASAEVLRERWSKMTDVHQFFGLLRDLKLSRRKAMNLVGQDYAWRIEPTAVPELMHKAAEATMPIMCFVGNRGCIQIHSGPVASIKPMGPWINVLDETFHLHLRTDHIAEVWGVRKPTKDGHVTSVEVLDASGSMIIQFFGKRHEGHVERDDWRGLTETLPRLPQSSAAA